ncbi:MAG: hypothetical protein ACFFFG_09095 [Candidatus Thorarchaeota archaeon]
MESIRADENWALFVFDNKIEWSFGSPDYEFKTFVVNFLRGLGNIAQEIFGENSVASIEFEVKKYAGLKASEVFIVSLQNKFFFVCSDAAITLKLISAKEGLPETMAEQIKAVLVGQASILFAHAVSNVKQENEAKIIESIFQNIIIDLNPGHREMISQICGRGSSNFSMLSFEELLLLHWNLRKQKGLIDQITPEGWALMSMFGGGEMPISWNVERDVILAGYLSVIIDFVQTLFGGARPKRLVFGTHILSSLEFVYGEVYFLVLDTSFSQLCNQHEFLNSFLSLPNHVLEDIKPGLRKLLVKEYLDYVSQLIDPLSTEDLLDTFQEISKSSGSSLKEKIRRMWKRLL